MSLFRIAAERFELVPRTTFAKENVLERKDIQRLLRNDLSPIGEDLMVIAEEFGDWEESNRRIDLLCLSRDASLVVVEIKRTDDGGHMELQAVRYAAMVARMTLEQVIAAYAHDHATDLDVAKGDVTTFLQEEADAELSGEARIVLVSADFSTELTTAVLWLNQHDLDIRCVRLRPHRLGDEILIDATQIIPLPETADYEVKVREQEEEKRKVLAARPRQTIGSQRESAAAGSASIFGSRSRTARSIASSACLAARRRTRNCSTRCWRSARPSMQDRLIDNLIRLEGSLKKPILDLKV